MAEPAWHLSEPAKPYDVQIEALRKAEGHGKFGYFLEQGMGKTSLVLNEYVDRLVDNSSTGVVVCPNSFKGDWVTAPADCGLDFSTSLWPRDPFCSGTTSRPHFNVINYEAVRSGGYDTVKSIIEKSAPVFIVDESSAIKNFQSSTARAILDLSKRVKVERLLNGTPMTQNVMDLVAQLKCLGELDGVNPYAFRNRFAEIGGYMGKKVVGVKNEEELHAIQDRCSFRALKKDWLDLPEKINRPLKLEMTNNQRRHYREMLQDFFTMVDDHEFTADMVVTQMDKMRQITSGILIDGDKFKLIDPIQNNPKVKASSEIIGLGGSKVIVVHFYKQMGLEIFNHYNREGFSPAFIRGGMKPDELLEEKKKFNNDPTCRVIVCQIQSAYQGHTLLGSEGNNRCNVTFFHDFTFSLLQRSQMEDRNHRGAQDRAVLYYDPIMSSIDQAQVDAIARKQDMATLVVDAVRALRGFPK